MDNLVPGVLQRLRAADIIRLAGLSMASLGQEYCRIGAVRNMKRQGVRLSGIVDLSHQLNDRDSIPVTIPYANEYTGASKAQYTVEIELQNTLTCTVACSCGQATTSSCQHAAALLYQWLLYPSTFEVAIASTTTSSLGEPQAGRIQGSSLTIQPSTQVVSIAARRGLVSSLNLLEILGQMGLTELRGIARENEVMTSGLSKQQLIDAIHDSLKNGDNVRKVAGALEKPVRQLLATIILAGGSISDEDLRGIFERFSLGQPSQLQPMLLTLQAKGLLFHTSLSSSSLQRIALSASTHDVGWYVPLEVRTALRVMVPVTAFQLHKSKEEQSETIHIEEQPPYALLADLLLVARALNGNPPGMVEEERREQGMLPLLPDSSGLSRNAVGGLTSDNAGTVPPPNGMPPQALLEALSITIPCSPAFLRFAIRLLRLADIVHKDDTGTPQLKTLANVVQLLLGPTRADVARDLFELWLASASYQELFDLQEGGLRLRSRSTPLNHLILRSGELEAENSEARQWLIALLAQAPLHQWINFPAFARFVYRLNPMFLQKRQRLYTSPHWWLEQEDGQLLHPTQLNEWLRAEGRYLAELLRGPLHWWGASDLALSEDGQIQAFRLTSVAGWLFNGLASEDEEEGENKPIPADLSLLEVQESGRLLLTSSPAAWSLIELIEHFAEVGGVQEGKLFYRLTPKSLSRALGQGKKPEELIKVFYRLVEWEDNSDGPLTQQLRQLETWIGHYGHMRLYTGVTLLEGADPLVMRELSAITSIDEQVIHAIQPTVLILKKGGAERIQEELKRRGAGLPLLHEEEGYGTERY